MRTLLLFAFLGCFVAAGCDKQSTGGGSGTKTSSSDNHTHEHGEGSHDHKEVAQTHTNPDGTTCTCEHGPNNGHIFRFENEDFKGEWVQSKDNDVVRFYLLSSKDENHSMKVDSFKVTPLAGADAVEFELEAENPDAEGKSNVYMADEKDLRIAIPLGVLLEVKSGDLVLKGQIDPHEPFDH